MAEHPRFPNSISYVRRQRHLSQAALAKELGTKTEKLARIERGDAVPTLRQYEILSSVLGVSDFTLASEEHPSLTAVLGDLRQPVVKPMAISPKGLRKYFQKTSTAELIEDIAQSLQVRPAKDRPRGYTVKNLPDRVQKAQELLSFDPRMDRWISEPEAAWRYLRYRIEQFGIYGFLTEVPPEDFRGLFTAVGSSASMVLVNKRTFKTKARLFTLVHEFAHFLLNIEGLSDPLIVKNDEEKSCNQFASNFLAPKDLIDTLVASRTRLNPSAAALIRYVSQNCLLSQGAVAYRLREDRFITASAYRSWFAANGMTVDYGRESTDEELAEQSGGGGGRYAYTVVSDFGFRPLEILQTALSQGAIDAVHVGRIINARGQEQDRVFKTVAERVADLSP